MKTDRKVSGKQVADAVGRQASVWGAIIRSHRKQLGLTQSELAKRADLSKTVIYQAEAGRSNMRMDSWASMFLALGIPIQNSLSSSPVTEGRSPSPAAASRVRLEIRLEVLKRNYERIARAVAPCEVIAVLKANAYGLGVRPIAAALVEAGVRRFAVAELREALDLTGFGLPVQILGSVLPEEIPMAVAAGVILPLSDEVSARAISEEAKRQKRRATGHVLVDTGMGRLGVIAERAEAFIREATTLEHLEIEGIYSHFPVAYRSGDAYTREQIRLFRSLLRRLKRKGIQFPICHIANSDAINNFPGTCRSPFNAVRTGINLHGSFDPEGRRVLELASVLTLKTRLTAVRDLPAGMHIGYGCTYRLPRTTRVGTISAGYADGLPLALSNRGYVLIRGRQCPILGRVSMDYTTVSLDQVPDAECGDEVICLGGEGPTAITVEDWAQLKGTHSYDIICSFGSRVERCYV